VRSFVRLLVIALCAGCGQGLAGKGGLGGQGGSAGGQSGDGGGGGQSGSDGAVIDGPGTPVCVPDGSPASSAEVLFFWDLNKVRSFSIDTTTGALSLPSAIAGPNYARNMVASPTANVLYVADPNVGVIDVYAMNGSDGSLTSTAVEQVPANTISSHAGPISMAIGRAGETLYVADELNVVDAFVLGAGGAFSPVPGSPFPASTSPEGIALTPNGKYLYVSNNYDQMGGISAFAVDSSTGALTAISGSPFPTGDASTGPGPLAVHPNGNFLFVALSGNVNANHFIAVFRIDPTTGVLSAVAGSPFTTGAGPDFMTLDPAGKFLYATLIDTVVAFSIDTNSGVLTPVVGSPYSLYNPAGLAFEASGQYLYVASGGSVAGFKANPCDGSLTALAGSPFGTGMTPSGESGALTTATLK
jgi:6-phosphogluconolactonase (cycloisomerase 2 family)